MAPASAVIRGGLALLVACALGASLASAGIAQSPEASPTAMQLPEGPLGEQIGWVIDHLNAASFDAAEVADHVAPSLLEQAAADQLAGTLLQIAAIGPFTLEPGSLVTTRDLPPTNARFTLAGQGGIRLAVSITVDRETGLITGLLLEPAEPRPQVTPVGTLREPDPEHGGTPGADQDQADASLPDAPIAAPSTVL